MKKLLLLALLSSNAFAQALPLPPQLPPLASEFKTYGQGIPLSEFLKINISHVLKKPYVLTPAAAAESSLISADLSTVKPSNLLTVIKEILLTSGYSIKEVSGVIIVDKATSTKQDLSKLETWVYSPRFKTVSDLTPYLSAFPDIKLTHAPGVRTPALSRTTLAPSSSDSPPQQSSNYDAGATNFTSSTDTTLLVAQGEKPRLELFKEFVKQVDIQVKEVTLKAYILEVRNSKKSDSGVSLAASILSDKLKLNLGTATTGNLQFNAISSGINLSVIVNSLASDSRVKLLSSPVLRASDGATASASIGTDTPTLGSIVTSQAGTQQAVNYQSSGVLLNISPRIFEDVIKLKISQEVSSFVNTDTGLTATPTKLRRSFVSDVYLKSGDVILLGGLSETKTANASSKSFWFFGSDSFEESDSEIVVLLSAEST